MFYQVSTSGLCSPWSLRTYCPPLQPSSTLCHAPFPRRFGLIKAAASTVLTVDKSGHFHHFGRCTLLCRYCSSIPVEATSVLLHHTTVAYLLPGSLHVYRTTGHPGSPATGSVNECIAGPEGLHPFLLLILYIMMFKKLFSVFSVFISSYPRNTISIPFLATLLLLISDITLDGLLGRCSTAIAVIVAPSGFQRVKLVKDDKF